MFLYGERVGGSPDLYLVARPHCCTLLRIIGSTRTACKKIKKNQIKLIQKKSEINALISQKSQEKRGCIYVGIEDVERRYRLVPF